MTNHGAHTAIKGCRCICHSMPHKVKLLSASCALIYTVVVLRYLLSANALSYAWVIANLVPLYLPTSVEDNAIPDQSVKCYSGGQKKIPLSHGQDINHAEKGYAEMGHLATLMFLTGHGMKARTHACVEMTHFLTQYIIKTGKYSACGCLLPRPWWCTSLRMCDFCMGMGSCHIPSVIGI